MTTSRWSSRALLLALSLALAAGAPRAALAKSGAAFKQHLAKGLEFYEQGEYEESIREFQSAYSLRQMPKLLFNIAQAHRKLGRAKEALNFYEFYLRVEPNPKPEVKAELETYIKQTKAMLAAAEEMRRKQELEEQQRQAEEQAMLGGARTDPAQEQAEREKLEREKAEKDRAEQERLAREQAEREKREKEAELARALQPPPAPPPPAKVPVYKKWWFWTAIGGGVAAVAGGVAGGLASRSVGPPDPMLPAGLDVRDQRFGVTTP